MKIGEHLANLKRIMLNQESLSKEEASILIETVLDTLIEVGNGVTDETLHEAADYLFKFRDFWFKHTVGINEEKKGLGVHSNAPRDWNNIPLGEVGPTGIPGELGPSNCPKGYAWESILDKPIIKSPGYVHKLPFILSKDATLSLNIKYKCNKVVILIVNEANQILSDLDVILPEGDKEVNISLGDK